MNKLFEPIKIGNITLKNRIVMAPMGTTTDTTNAFNMRDVNYYGERAKGGCGLVMTGAVVASRNLNRHPARSSPTPKTFICCIWWQNECISTALSLAFSCLPELVG